MRWRFWRRIKILPGVRLNVGKKGASVSLGPRGSKLTFGKKGVRSTFGLPGTGLFVTDYRKWRDEHGVERPPANTAPAPDERMPNWEFYFFQKLLNDRIGEWEHAWSEATVG